MQVQNVPLSGQISIKVVLVIKFCVFRLCDTSTQQVVWVSTFASHCQRTHKRDINYRGNGKKTTPNISIATNLLTNLQAIFHFANNTFQKLVSIFPDQSRLVSIHADPLTNPTAQSKRKRKDPVMWLHIWSHTAATKYVTLHILATTKVPYLPWSPV